IVDAIEAGLLRSVADGIEAPSDKAQPLAVDDLVGECLEGLEAAVAIAVFEDEDRAALARDDRASLRVEGHRHKRPGIGRRGSLLDDKTLGRSKARLRILPRRAPRREPRRGPGCEPPCECGRLKAL